MDRKQDAFLITTVLLGNGLIDNKNVEAAVSVIEDALEGILAKIILTDEEKEIIRKKYLEADKNE